MLFTVAWRNIWRSKTRTLVVIGSIIVGIWALVFLLGFFEGQVQNYMGNVIQNETSHLQYHHPRFKDDFESALVIPNSADILEELRTDAEIKATSERIVLNGMLASSAAVQGVMAIGVEPLAEQEVTQLDNKIVEGAPLDPSSKNQLLISRRMADKLKVKLRSKLVLTFQTATQEISSAAFRVAGIYQSNKRLNDELYIYANISDLRRLAEIPGSAAHEIAVVLHNFDEVEVKTIALSERHQDVLVENYRQLSPDLELMNSQIKINMTVMIVIFMLALIFGIINTMMMAVLERMRELGMLMAIGMNKGKVFLMVCLETLLISVIGAPVGIFLGFITIEILNRKGISLARWSAALEEFGMSDLVRPSLDASNYVLVAMAVVITGLLASIYPSIKATRLRPVEALRKI